MRSRRTIVIILCAALLPFALGAWYLLGNDEEAADASAPKIAQSGDTICDQFLATMPEDLSDRKKAGKVCVDALPKLDSGDQLRIANTYVSEFQSFIGKEEFENLIPKLHPDAALPLRAYSVRYKIRPFQEDAFDEAREILAEAERSNNPAALVNAIYSAQFIPFVDEKMEEFDDDAMGRALEIARREKMNGIIPYIHGLWGSAHERRGDLVESIEQYEEAGAQSEINGDYYAVAMTKMSLSHTYADFQDTDKAIELAQDAVQLLDEHFPAMLQGKASMMGALGEHLSAAGRNDEAVAILNDLAASYEQENMSLPPEYMVARIRALDVAGETEAAMKEAAAIIETGDLPPQSNAIVELQTWLGARHAEGGAMKEAKTYFDAVLKTAPSGEDGLGTLLDTPDDDTLALAFAYDLMLSAIGSGESVKAIDIAEAYRDRHHAHTESSRVHAIASHRLQTNIDVLESNAARSALALESSQLQLALAGLTTAMLAALAFQFYRSSQTQKRLTAEKNTYLDEIHHRTKNNFQVLSSILNLDIRRLDATEQGEGRRLDAVNRLQTMALVHDHIYSLDAAKDSAADLSDFIDDLLALMDESLGREDVTLEWGVIGGKIDVTRLTPFGLLLCELITNSYKHAFADSGGTIAIHISEVDGELVMTLKDNGKGFDIEAARKKPGRLGMGLIFDLADQIGGDLTVVSSEKGTVWTLQ